MKRVILSCALLLAAVLGYAQGAKKPTIMVVPSDVWCIQNGYYTTFDNQGTEEKVPDYTKAIQGDADLLLVTSKLGELMAERGFPLRSMEAMLKRLKTEEAEESLTMSKETGAELAESPLDKLKRVARADIWMQVTWTVNRIGRDVSVTFNLQGLDAYTDKQVAAGSGTSAPEPAAWMELPVTLSEAVNANLEAFCNQLMAHFQDMETKGREIALTCRCWSDSEYDFESEVGGDELGFLIEDWVAANTVEGRFTTADASESRMYFEQVRIPLFNENGRALDARSWANGLRRELREKYGIESKLTIRGLGQAILTIGGK